MTQAAQVHVPIGMASLLVFRATGDNHVFLGYREGNVLLNISLVTCIAIVIKKQNDEKIQEYNITGHS